MFTSNKTTAVLFNAHTLDGKAAAFACWSKMREHPVYKGVGYDTVSLFPHIVKRRLSIVYILGLHLTRSDLEKLCDCAEEIVFIDSTSFEDFEYGGCKYTCASLPDRSACVSAFGYFHPERVLPQMFNIIEDVDKNLGQMINSVYVYYGLQAELLDCFDNEIFLKAGQFLDPNNIANLAADGYGYYLHLNKIAKTIARNYSMFNASINGSEIDVLAINCNKLFNKAIVRNVRDFDLLFMYEDSIPADAGYSIRSWTVVSRYAGIPSNFVASKFGGYGSTTVAGFITAPTISPSEIIKTITGGNNE